MKSKLNRVYGTEKKQKFLKYLVDNKDRFYFYVNPVYNEERKRYDNLLYVLDEAYQDNFIVGEVEYNEPILCDISVYVIKPTTKKYYIDIVNDYIFYHFHPDNTDDLDSYEHDKSNYGLRVVVKDKNNCIDIYKLLDNELIIVH